MTRKTKILVIGKKNHLGWIEHTINGFRQNDCIVDSFFTNILPIKSSIKKAILKLKKDKNGEILLQLDWLNKKIKTFKPDMVFFIGLFFTNVTLLNFCKEKHIVTAGWVGDRFNNDKKIYIDSLDHLFLSDSAFMQIAQDIGFENRHFLQFGYDENLHKDLNIDRKMSINFVGSYTKERDEIFSYLKNQHLEIYGAKWNNLNTKSNKWNISNKKISQKKVVQIYNSTIATLNVAQKNNIINMVNMRTFEAIACGSCLLNDNVKDIELCFEPNKEILVYKNPDELQELSDKVLKDKHFAQKIAKNGKIRAEKSGYSYRNRTKEILTLCGFRG